MSYSRTTMPANSELADLAAWAEDELDEAGLTKSNPGRVGLHHLNRAESSYSSLRMSVGSPDQTRLRPSPVKSNRRFGDWDGKKRAATNSSKTVSFTAKTIEKTLDFA